MLDVDHKENVLDQLLNVLGLLRQTEVTLLQIDERDIARLGERVDGVGDDLVFDSWRRGVLPLLYPLQQLNAVCQQPLQLALEVCPTICVLWALAAHHEL
jgi:hypothetical protein